MFYLRVWVKVNRVKVNRVKVNRVKVNRVKVNRVKVNRLLQFFSWYKSGSNVFHVTATL